MLVQTVTFPGLVVAEDGKFKNVSERQDNVISWITKMELMFDVKEFQRKKLNIKKPLVA